MPAAKRKLNTTPSIQPNAGVRAWYERELRGLLEQAQYEILLALSVQFASRPVKLAADEYVQWLPPQEYYLVGEDGFAIDSSRGVHPGKWVINAADASPVTSLDKVMQNWADKWTLRFDKLSLDLAKGFASKSFSSTQTAMESGLKKAGLTIKFKPTRRSLEAYKSVIGENVALIKNLPSQYVTGVQTAVWQSVNKGADMATLSQKLRKNYEIAGERAALIATDQNHKAKAKIENTRRQQLGIKRAIWQHSSAGREPRPTHVEMNGVEFELARGMWDPDANGKGKGAWIWPGELINCRCTSRAILPGIEDKS